MAFTDAQKVNIRRYCGYPAFGSQVTPASGYRFFTHYGQLEYRINNLTTSEEAIVTQYLTDLQTLESAIVGTSANLDTESAAVWVHNKNEQRDRENLYRSWRVKLCSYLGVATGPALSSGINFVV